MSNTATVWKNGKTLIEVQGDASDGFEIELPGLEKLPLSIKEMFDGEQVAEINLYPSEIDALIDGLLDAKREHKNKFS